MVLLEPNLSDSFLFTVSLDYKLRIWSTKVQNRHHRLMKNDQNSSFPQRKDIKMILELLNYFAESRNSSSTAALTSLGEFLFIYYFYHNKK